MSVKVKTFFQGMLGMAAMGYAAGQILPQLRIALVTGTTAQSVDLIQVISEVAYVTIGAGFVTDVDNVIALANSTSAALNNQFRVKTAGPTGFSFDCPGVADGTYTGTATVNHPSAGWTEVFTATNVMVVRTADASASRPYIRIDDSLTYSLGIRAYETMTDAVTGTNPFPTVSQAANGARLPKYGSTSGTATYYQFVVSDVGLLYMVSGHYQTYNYVGYVGRFNTRNPNETYPFVVVGAPTDVASTTSNTPGNLTYNGAVGGVFFQRDYMEIITSPGAGYISAYTSWASGAFSGDNGCMYPNGPDGAIEFSPVLLRQNFDTRGTVPGLWYISSFVPNYTFTQRELLPGIVLPNGNPARAFAGSGSQATVIAYDAKGDW